MHRLVTVLFTDLVGSTALSARLGPERAEQLRREHFGLLREQTDLAGGTVVKNLGDGLMVAFDSPSAAASCAVAMQQAFDLRNRADDGVARLEIRIGVSVGDAVEEEGDFFGEPVIEAARLCALADGGQVLATELVARLAGTRVEVTFTPVGPKTLKGFPSPVEVVEVDWEPLDRATGGLEIPLASGLVPASGAVFVGRSVPLALADTVWKSVQAGNRRTLLIGGEAGVGKTTLLSRIAARCHDDGGAVLYGRCDEELRLPYRPWVESLSGLVRRLPREVVAAHVAERQGDLAAMLPELAGRVEVSPNRSTDAEADRYARAAAVLDLLRRSAELTPIVLVLDDLHWADRETVALLEHIAGVTEPLGLLLVATYRPSDLTDGHPLAIALPGLRSRDDVEYIGLGGLDDRELLALMEAIAGHPMDADGVAIRDLIAAETGGNAFFATEVLRHLAETGAIRFEDGRWSLGPDFDRHGLPASVREVITQRVARLGGEVDRALRYAAVIGSRFESDLLAEVLDSEPDTVKAVLDAAASSALVTAGEPAWSFVHSLVAKVLYDDLSAARRARIHRRVAEALEARFADEPGDRVTDLAYHWAASVVPQQIDKVVDYATLAGDRALQQLAPDEARHWYAQALEALGESASDPSRRVALCVRLGDAQRQAGDPAHRQTLLDAATAAHRLGSSELLVAAALASHSGLILPRVDPDRIEMLELALDAVGPDASAERVLLLKALVTELAYSEDLARRIQLATDADRLARALGEPRLILASLLAQLSLPEHVVDGHLRWADEAVRIAAELDDQVSLAIAAGFATCPAAVLGDMDRLEHYTELCVRAADRVPQPLLRLRALLSQGELYMAAGDLERAEANADEMFALSMETGEQLAVAIGQLANTRLMQGRLSELEPMADMALELSAGAGRSVEAIVRAALILLACEMGAVEDVRAGLEHEAGLDFVPGDYQGRLAYLTIIVEAVVTVGDRARAGQLLAVIEPYRHMVADSGSIAFRTVATCIGMLESLLARYEAADLAFEEACAIATRFRAPFLLSSTQVEWARSLLERPLREQPRAAALLDEAQRTADRFGLGLVARKAMALRAR